MTNAPSQPEAERMFVVGISGGKDSTAVLLWMVNESGIDTKHIRAVFCDTGNEHQITLDHVAMLASDVHPVVTIYPKLGFYGLARKKKRFPSAKARFCTEHLKIKPTQKYIEGLTSDGYAVVSVSGVRSDESSSRAALQERDLHGFFACEVWRPILDWTIDDVWVIHRKYGIARNKLYDQGAQRVGCLPCVMSRKAEIRMIALKYPERIALIAAAERAFLTDFGRYSSFFSPNKTPKRFHSRSAINKNGIEVSYPTVNDVVKWSMTGDRTSGRWDDQLTLFEDSPCKSGFCE